MVYQLRYILLVIQRVMDVLVNLLYIFNDRQLAHRHMQYNHPNLIYKIFEKTISRQNKQTHKRLVFFPAGAVAMMAGICGVPLGSFGGQMLRRKFAFGDPMVCGIGLFLAAPLLLSSLYFAASNTIAAYVLVFLGQLFLNLNWAVVSDILLYTVIPTRRSSAEAFQILFSHALGDASSPYIAGVVSILFCILFGWEQCDIM